MDLLIVIEKYKYSTIASYNKESVEISLNLNKGILNNTMTRTFTQNK